MLISKSKKATNHILVAYYNMEGGGLCTAARLPYTSSTLEITTISWHIRTPTHHIPSTFVLTPTRIQCASGLHGTHLQ